MAIPVYTGIPLSEVTSKTFLRQSFGRTYLRDNLINHEARLKGLETGARLFDHFNWRRGTLGAGTTDPDDNLSFENLRDVSVDKVAIGKNWVFDSDLADPDGARNGVKPAFSVARIVIPTTASSFAKITSLQDLRYDASTKPLTYEARLKLSDDILFFFGLRNDIVKGTLSDLSGVRGIGLKRSSSTQWVFQTNNGTLTTGTAFSKVTSGNWFIVKIVLTDDPSDRALCYVDGVLKETFTSQVPTDQSLYAVVSGATNSGTGANLDIDRVDWNAGALLDAA